MEDDYYTFLMALSYIALISDLCLTLSLVKILSRIHFDFFSSEKQDLAFHANCLHWRQFA